MPAKEADLVVMTSTPHVQHAHDPHDHDHDHDHGHEPRPSSPHDPSALISARGLTVRRGTRAVLQSVDLEIGPSEIVTLIGPNGAGKTTLVRALLGLETLVAGSVVRSPELLIGYVPQRFDLDRAIPMTVERFLALGRARDRKTQQTILDEVGAPLLLDRQFSELSGGELQRVLLARALLRNPTLLVLDEPVRGVDFAGEADLYALIARLRTDRGVGVLLISHDLHVVLAASDRVICINQHVCCQGVPEDVARHPEYARLFGPVAAQTFGLYRHAHDHRHDLSGAPVPGPISAVIHRDDEDRRP
jgi:zinc transport system ATP-binding protein